MLAHVAGEDVLREIFASGEDVHAATAAGIIGADPDAITPAERSKAKMVNYGIAYGLSRLRARRPPADRARGGRRSTSTATSSASRPSRGSSTQTIAKATDEGHVKTLMGRRRNIPELRSSNRQRRMLGERLAVNTVIQGTAADIIKLAMVRATARSPTPGSRPKLVLQIHDELLFEGPEAEMDAAAEDRRARDGRRPSSSTRRWRSTSASVPTGWRRSSRRPERAALPRSSFYADLARS